MVVNLTVKREEEEKIDRKRKGGRDGEGEKKGGIWKKERGME